MTFTINGLVYETINDNEVQLLKTEGLKRPVRNIPAEVEYDGKKYKVTNVWGGGRSGDFYGAFQKDEVLTNLSLPETVETITHGYNTYHGAFMACKKLKDIYFPDSLETIGHSAFEGCSAIETLYFGDNLETIGSYAFKGCTALKEIDFNDKLETIERNAFYNCTSLKNVSFPTSLKMIGTAAFSACKAMTEVNIPASVEKIDSVAFAGTGVKVVNIYSENINIAADAFPADAQINFLDANSFPKRKRKPRGAKNIAAPKATHASEEPAKPVQKEESPKETPKVVPVDMEKLIQAALTDGVVTDKERSILIKKVKEAGGDVDEFEMLLDARIFEATQKAEKPKEAPKATHAAEEAPMPAKAEEAKAENPALKPEATPAPTPEPNKEQKAKSGGFLKKLLGGLFSSSQDGKTETAAPAATNVEESNAISDLNKLQLTSETTVEALRQQFNETFGAQLKLYNGNKVAAPTDILGTLGLTTEGTFECRSSLTVGSFIERMKENHGLKVKVYTCDEWVAVLDGLTLKSAGLVKKSATKADMEGMIGYQREDGEAKAEPKDDQIKKSAVYEDYTIVVMRDNKVVVGKGDDFYDNTKGALREISGEVGFDYDAQWTTQQLGSKLVDFINGK